MPFSQQQPVLTVYRLLSNISLSVHCPFFGEPFYHFIPEISYLFRIHFISISYFSSSEQFKTTSRKLLHPQPLHNTLLFKVLEADKRNQHCKNKKDGVHIARGSSVKWKVVKPPATMARITTPTAKELTSQDTTSVITA